MVVLDARYLAQPMSGIPRHVLTLMHGLAEAGATPAVRVLVPPRWTPPAELADTAALDLVGAPSSPRDPRELLRWPGRLRRLGATVVHAPDAFAPLVAPGVAVAVTIHDLIPLTQAAHLRHTRKGRWPALWRAWVTAQARRADAVLTVSEHTRGLIRTMLRVPAEKVAVVGNAVASRHRGSAACDDTTAPRAPYVLCVGRFDPYKNADGLVHGFARWAAANPHQPHQLVFLGPPDARFSAAADAVARHGLHGRVTFVGAVSDDALRRWYAHAAALAMPSFEEGFGLPAVEAFAAGVPVLAARAGALPEVCGDAARWFDPGDHGGIAAALHDVLNDDELRRRLTSSGAARLPRFDVRAFAQRHLAIYERLKPTDFIRGLPAP